MNYILFFDEISQNDIARVGGKNASLGEMIQGLQSQQVRIPMGFAITVDAYRNHLESYSLNEPLHNLIRKFHDNPVKAHEISKEIRTLITSHPLSNAVAAEIIEAYEQLGKKYNTNNLDVAVRSSATAEDLPGASFAGQQESYLNIKGTKELLNACLHGMASLFTERAMIYRKEHGFDDMTVGISIGVQKMVRSDKASAGVAFTLEPESGFDKLVVINGTWGLGESLVQGAVIPDEWYVFKPIMTGKNPIIKKTLGHKDYALVYDDAHTTKKQQTTQEQQNTFCLTDEEVKHLAHTAITIENYFSNRASQYTPMDIEWAKDGVDGKLYIVQARPETVYAGKKDSTILKQIRCKRDGATIVAQGQAIGSGVATGSVCIVKSFEDRASFKAGDILVTTMTDPDWVPLMKMASGIITERGGRTCHAAIVARELSLPAIVGVDNATQILKNGMKISLDCSTGEEGVIIEGEISCTTEEIVLTKTNTKTPLMVITANPQQAFILQRLPVDGVGLARMEFILSQLIGVHPLAILNPHKLNDSEQEQIKELSKGFANPRVWFKEKLAQGIAQIAAAFYPREVIVRLSDLKTNEYRNLIGGTHFEPEEENPMLGYRGAFRYRHPDYKQAFELECSALQLARNDMGLTNLIVMIPFVRTPRELQEVIALMASFGLKRGDNGLKIYMMVEIPSNVILLEQFAPFVDGFSIGSNDLTQLTLGVDRDSALLTREFDERDEAVQFLLKDAIDKAKKVKKPIGICGQAPSDFPELARKLQEWGIATISLNPDAVISFLKREN
jgi:pyruvate,water dikinase